jgi:hypothetical protein
MMLGRNRLSFASVDVQTSQLQAIIGTPVLVPVPRKVVLREGYATAKNTKLEEVRGARHKVQGATS